MRVLGDEAAAKDHAAATFEQMTASVQALLDAMGTLQTSLTAKTEQLDDLTATLEVRKAADVFVLVWRLM